jgi:hypothetical protein
VRVFGNLKDPFELGALPQGRLWRPFWPPGFFSLAFSIIGLTRKPTEAARHPWAGTSYVLEWFSRVAPNAHPFEPRRLPSNGFLEEARVVFSRRLEWFSRGGPRGPKAPRGASRPAKTESKGTKQVQALWAEPTSKTLVRSY